MLEHHRSLRRRVESGVVGSLLLFGLIACRATESGLPQDGPIPVAATPTDARALDGRFISWREHIIDDEALGGVEIRGGDGLAMADLDGDGFEDVVSVHESDTVYDGSADGHVRIAFGTATPDEWYLVTLAEGEEAGAAEDVAIADLNGDGLLDVVVACELAHLIYFENPGADSESLRSGAWPRAIVEPTRDRGSYIRVFAADFDRDGRPEVVTPNKGAQNPDINNDATHPISWFEVTADPLSGVWVEHELTRVIWPINSQTVDLDGDGDLDVVAGSTGEGRIILFENVGASEIEFQEHPIEISGTTLPAGAARPPFVSSEGALVNGFNMAFADLNGDQRLDLVATEYGGVIVWLEQPMAIDEPWQLHRIGDIQPDTPVGLTLADIDGDGDRDVFAGAYSRSERAEDGEVDDDTPLGRLAWFENPGSVEVAWTRHDVSRRKRGMFDGFVARDMDADGDIDFVGTRGNSAQYDGVFWLEQVRSEEALPAFDQARESESQQMPLPE